MGGVSIGHNLRRESSRIDARGNIINAKTKEPIQKIEDTYTPTKEELESLAAKPPQEPIKQGESALGGMIAKKVEEKIGEAIAEAVGKMDISSMVSRALEQALK